MWAADTSWLFALFDPVDEHHAHALREAGVPGTVVVNPTTLTEFLDLAKRRHGAAASFQALEDLTAFPTVRFVGPPKTGTMVRVIEKSKGIGWLDAAAIATALEENVGLRTFDAAQRKAHQALK